MAKREEQARVGEILDRLGAHYPEAECALRHGDPLQLLVATILSAAMMLEWLDTAATRCGAEMIRSAVNTVFSDRKARTRDMGGRLSTSEMGETIAQIAQAMPPSAGAAVIR